MYRLKRSMYTETAHFLRHHEGLCKHMHGHSYKWTVELGAENLTDDMVMDFGHLKKIMEETIGQYDHAVVIDKQKADEQPPLEEQRVIVFSHRPTAERMAADVYSQIEAMLPIHIKLVKVICRETKNNEAIYEK